MPTTHKEKCCLRQEKYVTTVTDKYFAYAKEKSMSTTEINIDLCQDK